METGDPRMSRVRVLIEQQRYSEAEEILKDLLTGNPTNIGYLYLLAEVKLQQDKLEEALQLTDNAIGLSPESDRLFFLKAHILVRQRNLDEAEKYLNQAISLDSDEADYFAFLGHVKLVRKQYDKALELADKALWLDSENLIALNTRSTALLKLNKSEESFETIEGALREDPDNAYTHANYGWGLLEKGNHKKALEHFKEALKSDPNNAYAQAGMMEALKAANPIYKLFLKYAFWMSNMTAKYQWGVIIGFYIGFRVLRGIAASNEALQPFLTPVLVLLAVFAFSTWVINPISNLFLRFNRYGRFLLNKKQKLSSNFVGISLAICLTGVLLYFVLQNDKFLAVAAYGFAMMVPLSVMFSPTKYKNALLIYATAMAVVGAVALFLVFSTGQILNPAASVFMLGFIAFQWIANYMMIKEDNV